MTVDAYLQMLNCELAGATYAKAEYRRDVQREVERSAGAIDYKFNNISAVLDELGAVWVPGYRPLRHVQDRLRTLVRERFAASIDLRAAMRAAVANTDVPLGPLGGKVDPPAGGWPEGEGGRSGVLDVDFAAIESANKALGLAGERAVVTAEQERLEAAGRSDLAQDVQHVSLTRGDGLGYDVQSFRDLTDEPIYIEVKTTRFGKEVPFFVSRNEVEVSKSHAPRYSLWRLYRYGKSDTGYYRLDGALTKTAELRPESYRGLPATAVLQNACS